MRTCDVSLLMYVLVYNYVISHSQETNMIDLLVIVKEKILPPFSRILHWGISDMLHKWKTFFWLAMNNLVW